MMLFLLSQDENDLLLIDQPEDDLDSQTVYEEVVNLIGKTNRVSSSSSRRTMLISRCWVTPKWLRRVAQTMTPSLSRAGGYDHRDATGASLSGEDHVVAAGKAHCYQKIWNV
jgi:hypothetical protein